MVNLLDAMYYFPPKVLLQSLTIFSLLKHCIHIMLYPTCFLRKTIFLHQGLNWSDTKIYVVQLKYLRRPQCWASQEMSRSNYQKSLKSNIFTRQFPMASILSFLFFESPYRPQQLRVNTLMSANSWWAIFVPLGTFVCN